MTMTTRNKKPKKQVTDCQALVIEIIWYFSRKNWLYTADFDALIKKHTHEKITK